MTPFIVIAVKLLVFLLRLLKAGGGTSLPGLFIERYYPTLVTRLSRNYKKIILITGTNGKTTTQQLLRHLLESRKIKVVSNISGANLFRGIATAIISDCNLVGKARSDIAVFEVEEATMPILTRFIKPSFIIVTSLYRDQLDAYGEVVKTRQYILDGVKNSRRTKVVLNGDDENVASLASDIKNKVFLFNIRDERKKEIFFEKCHFKYKGQRNVRRIYAKNISIEDDLSTHFSVYGFAKPIRDLHFNSPGLQNVYNALAALVAASSIHKFKNDELRIAFSSFSPAFGRGEFIRINGKQLRLLLIKNPASFSANLNMLKNIGALKLLIIINDKIADGRDVSWLWDSKVELLQNSNIAWITVSGIRARDMLLRLKYAGLDSINIELEENISEAFGMALSKLQKDETLFILPTYTAMLDVRKAIGNLVKIKEFWKG